MSVTPQALYQMNPITIETSNYSTSDQRRGRIELICQTRSGSASPVIIATKSDKIKRSQLQKQVALLRRTLREESHVDVPKDAGPIRIIPWSGQTKDGREEIYAVLDGFLTEEAGQENL